MSLDHAMKREIVHQHTEAEIKRDWPAALATMVDEPFYEHYPFGLQVRGRVAVMQQWERLLDNPDFVPKALDARVVEWFSGDVAVQMYEWDIEGSDGTKVPSRCWAIFTFKGDLIESERIFYDHVSENLSSLVFSAEFVDLDGVNPIPNEAVTQVA